MVSFQKDEAQLLKRKQGVYVLRPQSIAIVLSPRGRESGGLAGQPQGTSLNGTAAGPSHSDRTTGAHGPAGIA